MPTIKQLIRNARQPIRNVTKSPALRGCPQRRGTCTRVYLSPPKNQTLPYVKLPEYDKPLGLKSLLIYLVLAIIHKNILKSKKEGGRVKDLPGVRYHIVRGTLDAVGVKDRQQGRSSAL
uniref:Ribosomal protein S12 n=1 Tax=Commiphora gileadensis TaxID=1700993 RepID=A0A410PA36_9ROSI|nr:ribosomal protein S12 [Commiphora gileadensis]QAT19675.1 ribosomal protein S12 [Commiphora gileadensis]